jgi:hypothetical protein
VYWGRERPHTFVFPLTLVAPAPYIFLSVPGTAEGPKQVPSSVRSGTRLGPRLINLDALPDRTWPDVGRACIAPVPVQVSTASPIKISS